MASAAPRALRLAGLLLCLGAASGIITTALSAGSNERAVAGRVKSGTGFFVSRDGFLVTSAHVVAGCRNLSAWRPDGTQRPSYVVAFDRRRDVALLWADGMSGGLAATVAGMPPQPGAEVYTLGYGVVASRPLSPTLVEGWLIGDRVARPGNRVVVFRGSLHAGHSGGAVLAGDGSLIGMVVGRDDEFPEFGVAIPKEDIEALLSPYGVQLPRRASTPSARDVLEAISVLIQCSNDGGPESLRKSGFADDYGLAPASATISVERER
jgi:S1-C subfamily serine protease